MDTKEEVVAHFCANEKNGCKYRPWPRLLCSSCIPGRDDSVDLTVRQLVNHMNARMKQLAGNFFKT
jgi:hypothetical protein